MASRHQEMQRIVRRYKDETGTREVDMHEVTRWAVAHGWPLPKPIDPLDRLAQEFSRAAREEIRYDGKTKKPYRANHAYPVVQGGRQLMLWIDIDEAPRSPMLKSLVLRREQMVDDAVQLTLDADHWNSIHPTEEPIELPLDLMDDVAWRKNAPDDESETG